MIRKNIPNHVHPDYVYVVSERQDQHSIRQPNKEFLLYKIYRILSNERKTRVFLTFEIVSKHFNNIITSTLSEGIHESF